MIDASSPLDNAIVMVKKTIVGGSAIVTITTSRIQADWVQLDHPRAKSPEIYWYQQTGKTLKDLSMLELAYLIENDRNHQDDTWTILIVKNRGFDIIKWCERSFGPRSDRWEASGDDTYCPRIVIKDREAFAMWQMSWG